MSEVLKQLYEEGREEGRKQGIQKGFISALISLVKDGILSIADAASRANMSVESFEKYMQSMK